MNYTQIEHALNHGYIVTIFKTPKNLRAIVCTDDDNNIRAISKHRTLEESLKEFGTDYRNRAYNAFIENYAKHRIGSTDSQGEIDRLIMAGYAITMRLHKRIVQNAQAHELKMGDEIFREEIEPEYRNMYKLNVLLSIDGYSIMEKMDTNIDKLIERTELDVDYIINSNLIADL